MNTLLHLSRILVLLLVMNEYLLGQCINPSISLPDISTPVNGNPATAYCVTLKFDPAMTGYPTGLSMLLQHTYQGDLDLFINACGNTLNIMQRPGAIGNCAGGTPFGNPGDIGSPGNPAGVTFSDTGGADPENGIPVGGGSFGITADDACGVGTPGINSFASLWAGCPPGEISAQICIGDHAFGDSGVAQNISLTFPTPIVCGCTDPNASNYNPAANVDDGSCMGCSLPASATPTQPSCNLNNGSISVTPSGGGYTYVWSPASLSGSNPTNLSPGTYSVTVTETATGCIGSASVTLNPSTALTVTATPVQPSCGLDNGSISVSPAGAGYSYTWSPASVSGSNPTNLAPGTYSVTVTQTSNGCTGTASVTLNPGTPITAALTPTQPTCSQDNGSISVSPSGPGYTYVWSPASVSGSNPANLPPGTYSVTVTQTATGCMDDASVTLNPSTTITAIAAPSQPTCGLTNGSISVSPSGPGYTYVWSPGSLTGSNPTNLGPGTYSVTVTETASGCMDDVSVTLNPSVPIMVTATPTQPTCALNNGGISVSPSGGGYTYVWNPASVFGPNPTNLAPGGYSVTVTETATGCIGNTSVTLNPSSPVMVSLTVNQPTCGQNNGFISVMPSGPGYTYTWNPATISGSAGVNLPPGTYSVTVTQIDGGCMDNASVTLNPSSPPAANATANPAAICEGGSTQLTATGGGTYTWSTGQTGPMITVSPTATTTYSVTVNNSGCAAVANVTVTVNTVTATATASPATACSGDPVQLTATGGGTYVWSTGQSGSMIPVNPTATTTYSVTVTNNGCTDVANVTVTVNTVTASATANPATVCSGAPVQLTATGGGTYSWSTGQSGAMITVNPTATTTYSVTVTNNGCTDVADVTVTVNTVTATAIADPLVVCAGDPVLLTATGGGTYAWSTGQTAANVFVNPVATTTYTVTVTNNGCTDVADVTVTVSTVNATAVASPNPICVGQSTVLTATGGGTYAWSTGQSGASITVSPTTTTPYVVTVTNNGCTGTATINVVINSVNASITANPNPVCAGNATVLTATGGATYSWSTGQSGPSITVIPASTTTYSVTATNAGCTDIENITVTVNSVTANATAAPATICDGASSVLTATGGGTYSWSTGQSGAMITVSPTATTTYSVTVTNNGCTDVADVTVTVNSATAQASASPTGICEGATSVLTATGGGTYSWSTGQIGASITVAPTATTTYMVTVTNNGCTDVASVTVNVTTINATATANPGTVCAGQPVQLNATGGGTYLWSTGQPGATINAVIGTTTTFSVTVTNNGCTDVAMVTVNVNSVVATATASPSAICPGLSSTLTATGGGTYLWSTGQSGPSISVMPATTTTYSVTVTNGGCTSVANVTVNVSGVLTPAVTASPATVCPGQPTVLTASGGDTYSWSTGQTGATITVSPSMTTTYTVTSTDDGCTGTADITVIVDPSLTATASASPATVCAGQTTSLTATGGGNYIWSDGQSGSPISVSPTATTTYTVTVTNNGCSGTANVTVNVTPPPVAGATANPAAICAGQTTSLTATGGGTYLWSNSQIGPSITVAPTATTTYTVTVTNNGCTASADVTVTVNPLPTPSAMAAPGTVCAGETASLMATGGGTYAWSDGQNGSPVSVTPSGTTTYTVTVTTNGCTATASTNVTVTPLPLATALANPATICAGQTSTLTASGGATYQWSSGQSGASIVVSPSSTTVYTVTVTNNGCSETAETTVTVNPLPMPTATASPASVCIGQSANLSATGDGTYSWSDGQSGSPVTVTPATTTTYSVTVTNNGCTGTADVTVTVNTTTAAASAIPATICPGLTSVLTATGGGTYLWSTGQSGASINVTPAATTTYFVTVTNNGCTDIAQVTVNVENNLSATATANPNVICAGESATLFATGGGTYAWSSGQSGASVNVMPVSTTTYTVTVTNNGCTGTASVTVAVNPLPTPTATANPGSICPGQGAILMASGGGTYTWSSGESGPSVTVTPQQTTTYTVTVTNNGCSATADVTVTVNPVPAPGVSASPGSICEGQSTTLTATGGGTYLWSTGQVGASITVTPASTTIYTVSATNNGCTGTAEVTVTVNATTATASAAPATICPGLTSVLTATGGGTYAWSTGQSGASVSVTPSTTTTYTVTVTNNGCTDIASVTVNVQNNLVATASANPNPLCLGQSTTISATGGGTYIWSDGQQGASISVTPSATTTYSVTATSSGCTGTASVTVVVNPIPVPTASASPPTLCAGQTTTLMATGGGTYAWSSGQSGASVSVMPGSTTTYTVTVTNNGCSATADVTVTVNPFPAPGASASPAVLCAGESTTLTATGGSSYLWSTGQSGTSISVSPASTTLYTVTATDNGCAGTASVNVVVNPLPVPVAVASPGVICTGQSATLTASGGSTYLWNTGQTNASISVSPLDTTTYTVTAASNGCNGTTEVTLFVNTTTATATADLTTVCPGLSTDITATGGGTYLWSTGETNAVISVTPLAATTYSVTVTNNGCTDVASVTVLVNNVLIPNVEAAPAIVCPGQATTLTASGGTTYIWDTGATDPSISVAPSATTTYSVTVTNNGCTGSGSVTVTVDASLSTTATASPDTICAGQAATLTATGGGTYLWSEGQTDASISVMLAGTTTYSVTVSNNGCTGSSEVTVVVRPLPLPAVMAAPDILCAGQSTTLTATGGDTYLWEDGQTGASITVTPSATTTYTVIANDNGCTGTGMVTVTVQPGILPAVTASPDSLCPGASATLTATGGDTYLWSSGQSGPSIVVTPAASVTYTVTVTGSVCEGTASATVTVNPLPSPVATANPAVLCIGQSTTLTVTGGSTYQWGGGQTGASIVVTPSATTTYSVTATDSNGCQASTSVTVLVNPLPVPTVTATPSLICAGDTTLVTATGGTSYLWSTGATAASVSVFPTNTTVYAVTVTNLGCTASVSTTVQVNPLPTALADPDTICVGESAVLTASGGDLYQWSTGQTGSTITVSPVVTTTYSVTVIEKGCVAIVPVTVTVNPLPIPVILVSPPVICQGESSTLTVSGGTSFVWSTGASGTIIPVSPLATASFSVTATENGCVGTTQTTVLVSQPPFAVVASTATICNGPGGPAVLNFISLVTGGDQSGIWTDVQNSGATGIFPNLDFTGVTPGNYLFRYTTQSASVPCGEVEYEVNVEVVFCNCPSVATIAGGPLCNAGGTLDLSTLVQTNEPGAWSLVGVPAGNIPAVVTNGIFNALNADAGVYELRFTLLESPPSGCPAFSTQLISVEAAVSAGVPAQSPHICFGENEIFDLYELLDGESTGGQWTETSAIPSSGGAFISASGSFEATNQQPAIYRFRYRLDSGGVCPSDEAIVAVEIEPLPVAQAGTDKTLDCVLTEVSLDGSGSSTGTNIVYLWTTNGGNILSGANSLSPLVDASGSYQLLVTDQTYGCTATDIATVIANNLPPTAAAIAIKDPLCHNQTNGSISVTAVTGGSAPYLYSFNQQPFTTSPDFIGLSGGIYTIEIEDANGCRWETEVVLENPSVISVNAGPDVTIFYGDSTVLEAVTLPLGGDYVYSWTPSDSLLCGNCDQAVARPDSTTLYQVLVTDANGCQDRDEVRVTVRIRRDVYVPNGFSPNNDGVNDVIMVYAGEGVEKVLEFDIYSRWGESVFYAANFPPNNPLYGWNGFFRNKPAVLDVYVYYVRILYKDGTEKLFKGDVMLMR